MQIPPLTCPLVAGWEIQEEQMGTERKPWLLLENTAQLTGVSITGQGQVLGNGRLGRPLPLVARKRL